MPRSDYSITAARAIGRHKLQLTFADGSSGVVDLSKQKWEGVFAPLADPEYFAQVSVDPELGTVGWPNGADMAPDALYEDVRAAAGWQ